MKAVDEAGRRVSQGAVEIEQNIQGRTLWLSGCQEGSRCLFEPSSHLKSEAKFEGDISGANATTIIIITVPQLTRAIKYEQKMTA